MIFQVKLVHIAGLLVCIPLSVHRIWDVHSIHSLMFERIPTVIIKWLIYIDKQNKHMLYSISKAYTGIYNSILGIQCPETTW